MNQSNLLSQAGTLVGNLQTIPFDTGAGEATDRALEALASVVRQMQSNRAGERLAASETSLKSSATSLNRAVEDAQFDANNLRETFHILQVTETGYTYTVNPDHPAYKIHGFGNRISQVNPL